MDANISAYILQAFAVGPKFKGIKMVPPGPHFISCQARGKENEFAPTAGFFVHLESRQVLVRTWDAVNELAVELEDEDQVGGQAACIAWHAHVVAAAWASMRAGAHARCGPGADRACVPVLTMRRCSAWLRACGASNLMHIWRRMRCSSLVHGAPSAVTSQQKCCSSWRR